MATAVYSLVTRTPVRGRLAMTGELTLTGRIMAIGGVKEKTIAARRNGIRTILFPADNRKDFDELPAHIRRGLDARFVATFPEVVRICFGTPAAAVAARPA
jgi:ATP-dependent Lon protease